MPSSQFRRDYFAAELNDALIPLLTITYPGLAPVRLARNAADVVSRGDTYAGCALNIPLPADDGDRLPTVRLVVDNVDQALTDALREIAEPADVVLELVQGAAPNTVEAGPYYFTVRAASWNWSYVEFELGYEDILNLGYPADALDPQVAPGLFK